jgi:hypothetical protein
MLLQVLQTSSLSPMPWQERLAWRGLSDLSRDLVRRFLVVNEQGRIRYCEAVVESLKPLVLARSVQKLSGSLVSSVWLLDVDIEGFVNLHSQLPAGQQASNHISNNREHPWRWIARRC